MSIKDIDKLLNKGNLPIELRKSLIAKKKILTDNKEVKK